MVRDRLAKFRITKLQRKPTRSASNNGKPGNIFHDRLRKSDETMFDGRITFTVQSVL